MIEIALIPLRGGLHRLYPTTGYLGLTPVSVQGTVRTIPTEIDPRPIPASRISVRLRCYEGRGAVAHAPDAVVAWETEQVIWRAGLLGEEVDAGGRTLLGKSEQPFGLSIPRDAVEQGALGDVLTKDYRSWWSIEALVHCDSKERPGNGIILLRSSLVSIPRYSLPQSIRSIPLPTWDNVSPPPPPTPPSPSPPACIPPNPYTFSLTTSPISTFNAASTSYARNDERLQLSLRINRLEPSLVIKSVTVTLERHLTVFAPSPTKRPRANSLPGRRDKPRRPDQTPVSDSAYEETEAEVVHDTAADTTFDESDIDNVVVIRDASPRNSISNERRGPSPTQSPNGLRPASEVAGPPQSWSMRSSLLSTYSTPSPDATSSSSRRSEKTVVVRPDTAATITATSYAAQTNGGLTPSQSLGSLSIKSTSPLLRTPPPPSSSAKRRALQTSAGISRAFGGFDANWTPSIGSLVPSAQNVIRQTPLAVVETKDVHWDADGVAKSVLHLRVPKPKSTAHYAVGETFTSDVGSMKFVLGVKIRYKSKLVKTQTAELPSREIAISAITAAEHEHAARKISSMLAFSSSHRAQAEQDRKLSQHPATIIAQPTPTPAVTIQSPTPILPSTATAEPRRPRQAAPTPTADTKERSSGAVAFPSQRGRDESDSAPRRRRRPRDPSATASAKALESGAESDQMTPLQKRPPSGKVRVLGPDGKPRRRPRSRSGPELLDEQALATQMGGERDDSRSPRRGPPTIVLDQGPAEPSEERSRRRVPGEGTDRDRPKPSRHESGSSVENRSSPRDIQARSESALGVSSILSTSPASIASLGTPSEPPQCSASTHPPSAFPGAQSVRAHGSSSLPGRHARTRPRLRSSDDSDRGGSQTASVSSLNRSASEADADPLPRTPSDESLSVEPRFEASSLGVDGMQRQFSSASSQSGISIHQPDDTLRYGKARPPALIPRPSIGNSKQSLPHVMDPASLQPPPPPRTASRSSSCRTADDEGSDSVRAAPAARSGSSLFGRRIERSDSATPTPRAEVAIDNSPASAAAVCVAAEPVQPAPKKIKSSFWPFRSTRKAKAAVA